MNVLEAILEAILAPFHPEPRQGDYVLAGMTPEAKAALVAEEAAAAAVERNTCRFCGDQIQVQIFKELGYCSENHRKALEAGATSALEVSATAEELPANNPPEPNLEVQIDEQHSACNFCGRSLIRINGGSWNHATIRDGDTPHDPQPIEGSVENS